MFRLFCVQYSIHLDSTHLETFSQTLPLHIGSEQLPHGRYTVSEINVSISLEKYSFHHTVLILMPSDSQIHGSGRKTTKEGKRTKEQSSY